MELGEVCNRYLALNSANVFSWTQVGVLLSSSIQKTNETGIQRWGWELPLRWAQSTFDVENKSISFQSKKQDANIMMLIDSVGFCDEIKRPRVNTAIIVSRPFSKTQKERCTAPTINVNDDWTITWWKLEVQTLSPFTNPFPNLFLS